MRLDRLDLTRYGKFTGAFLSFGPRVEGEPDFHVVYGDNEAGKSTTFMALLDVLFGFENDNPFRFLHDDATLCIGAALDAAAGRHEVMRLWKPRGLLGADGQPLPEGLFSQDLAGIDRASYKAMFSLDEASLAEGGRSILASKGDLGQLLFAASSGLSEFGRTLSAVRTQTDTFFKSHTRKHELADLKKRAEDLRQMRAGIDVLATVFNRLKATRSEADAAYETAVLERSRLRVGHDKITRHANALPRLAEWRSVMETLEGLPEYRPVPTGWLDILPQLRLSEFEVRAKLHAVTEEIGRHSADLNALEPDPSALDAAPRFERLVADLLDRYKGAVRDLPDRSAKAVASTQLVKKVLRDLGQEDCQVPPSLLLARKVTTGMRSCIEARSGVDTALIDATREVESAERSLMAATDALVAAGDEDRSQTILGVAAAVGAVRNDDGEVRLRLAERTLSTDLKTLQDRLSALEPWKGDVVALAALRLPALGERDRWRTEMADAATMLDRCASDQERLDATVRRLNAETDALTREGTVIDDAAAQSSRSTRDAAWKTHRAAMDAASADKFEGVLRADDDVGSLRFAQASEIAELRGARRALASAIFEQDEGQRRLSYAQERLASLRSAASNRVDAFVPGLEPRTLEALDLFCDRRQLALDASAASENARAEVHEILADIARSRALVAQALEAASVAFERDADLGRLIIVAQAAIDGETALSALREKVSAAKRDLQNRKDRRSDAHAKETAWARSWEEACAGTWLSPEERTPDIATVRETLDLLVDLSKALDEEASWKDRVTKMEADRTAFARELDAISVIIKMRREGQTTDELYDGVQARVTNAQAVETARTVKASDIEKAQHRKADIDVDLETVASRRSEMTAYFGVDDLTEVATAIDVVRRRNELEERAERLAREIVTACGTATVEEAVTILSAINKDALEAERIDLEARAQDQDQRTLDLFAARSAALDALSAIGGDDAAARLDEERRTVLLDLSEKALQHVAMRAGIIAAERALAIYRERHRSAMMAQASELFRAVTRDSYSGLRAQPSKDSEILVGIPAGGGSRIASDMSTGTRAQLFLALRIAGYREFTKTRHPVPFVMDDVLETFDDDRASAALVQLSDMACIGQVVYFTHHRHLCDIARDVCPGARFHDLRH